MGDPESALPPSKKRGAGIQLTKDNPEADDDASELETGTFKRASDEVLATRKMVKVRRTQAASVPSSNPFATICLAPPSVPGAKEISSSVQADATVLGQKDSAKEENCGIGGGTESGTAGKETNETENSNRKLGDTTDVSAEVDDEVKSDAVEVATKPVETKRETENGRENTGGKAGREKTKGEKKVTESIGACEKAVGEKTEGAAGASEKAGGETEKETLDEDKNDARKPVAPVSSFQQLSSSQNAFTGLAGTGFGSSSFSFGTIVKEGPAFGSSSGSIFGFKNETQSFPSFGAGNTNNGTFSFQLSGVPAQDSTMSGVRSIPSMQEVPVETGEESERVVFTADAILYEYLDGGWKERGKGELKVNTQISDAQKSRLVMRARGNYRLILNASIFPEMNLTKMDKKGITFACVNSAGDSNRELATFALKFKDSSFVEEFRGVVTAHKGMKDNALKTPENSPKASNG